MRAALMTWCMRFRREQDIWKLSGVAYCMDVNYFISNKTDGGHSVDRNSDLRRRSDNGKRKGIAISS